jgi:hypothetical protein
MLGGDVVAAESILTDLDHTLTEPIRRFTFPRFDGTQVTV